MTDIGWLWLKFDRIPRMTESPVTQRPSVTTSETAEGVEVSDSSNFWRCSFAMPIARTLTTAAITKTTAVTVVKVRVC